MIMLTSRHIYCTGPWELEGWKFQGSYVVQGGGEGGATVLSPPQGKVSGGRKSWLKILYFVFQKKEAQPQRAATDGVLSAPQGRVSGVRK